MIILYFIFLILILTWAIVATFYALKFAKIIIVLEDDIAETVEVHEQAVETFNRILSMQLFFDSPEVKVIVSEALDDIKMAKIALQKVIKNFTARSKQNYIRYEYSNSDQE